MDLSKRPAHLALWCRDQLQRLDQVALQVQPELMEVAGAALAQSVRRETLQRVELWIGPGNNGGDGLVAEEIVLLAVDVRRPRWL